MAKRQSGTFDLSKYVAAGIRVELAALKATQTMLEAQLARFTKSSEVEPGKHRGRPAPVVATGVVNVAGNDRQRRKMSAAARKRISDAQKARWAKQKAAKANTK
jgi:hypothetical protein